MSLNLTKEDLKLIASAITWTLYTPFERSDKPGFSLAEEYRLQDIFESMCACRNADSTDFSATIDPNELHLGSNVFLCEDVANIISCVSAFFREIGHSNFEALAVTGVPVSNLETLNKRLMTLLEYN